MERKFTAAVTAFLFAANAVLNVHVAGTAQRYEYEETVCAVTLAVADEADDVSFSTEEEFFVPIRMVKLGDGIRAASGAYDKYAESRYAYENDEMYDSCWMHFIPDVKQYGTDLR